MKKYLKDYCVGCGLCQSVGKAELTEDEKGYSHPQKGDENWLDTICPAGGTQQEDMDFNHVWGKVHSVYYGWSTNALLRQKASSGGVLTEIAAYLLESDKADAILHTCMAVINPTETEICISTTRDQLVERCGSRYAISHPLSNLAELDRKKRYAFIGKPCDVTALRNYMRINPETKKMIPYTLSFFCAGLPSRDAQAKLLHEMGCTQDIKELRYRGNGWPGMATAVEADGQIRQMDYNSSWGKILGRDIMKMCRFCLDGIGEMADISCCDAWYLTEDGKPDFTEAEGRNAIFCRTEAGTSLLNEAVKAGNIKVERFENFEDDLKHIQAYQYDRRATMSAKIFALKIMRRETPQYSRVIRGLGENISIRHKLSVFKGTVTRILNGKI